MGRKVVITLHKNDLRCALSPLPQKARSLICGPAPPPLTDPPPPRLSLSIVRPCSLFLSLLALHSVHDNALFHAAHDAKHKDVTHVLPVFVFDERFVELSGLPGYQRQGPEARTRQYKFWRTGAFRARYARVVLPLTSRTARACEADAGAHPAPPLTDPPLFRFLLEGVFDLRDTLRKHGSDLLIRFGKMEDVTADIARDLIENGDEVKEVFLQEEVRGPVSLRTSFLVTPMLTTSTYQFYTEEKAIERKLRNNLKKAGVPLTCFDQVPLSASGSLSARH